MYVYLQVGVAGGPNSTERIPTKKKLTNRGMHIVQRNEKVVAFSGLTDWLGLP